RRHTRCLSDWSSDVCSSDLRIARELKVDRGTVSRYARSATPSATADRQLRPPCYEDHDPHVEQLRPLARVLLLQARREMAAAAEIGRASCRERGEMGGGSGG